MKVSVIVYHKNISLIYKKEWIEKSFNSILEQSYKDFSIYELNYGDDDYKLYREFPNDKEYHYFQIEMKNHAEAMNFLLNECVKDGYDVVFNINLDDINHKKRFETQIKYIKKGFDIVSSNFIYIDENDNQIKDMTFDKVNISDEFQKGNNVICHPGVCYSRNFLLKNKYITSEIPAEDFNLWKRTIENFKYFICPQYLINYRIHGSQVTKTNENKSNKKVGLLIIATNEYLTFLKPLIESADKYFLSGYDITYFIFTNIDDIDIKSKNKIEIFKVKHKEWPWMTLGRYKIFHQHSGVLSEMDYLFYSDVDMLFISEVGEEILSDLVGTQHPGYYERRGSPETNPESLAYVSPDEEMQYFAGGFNGGTSREYLKMAKKLHHNIQKDFENDIIAEWHDESHLNRYFIDNVPTKILSPSYCYSENNDIPFEKKLLALDKEESFQKMKISKKITNSIEVIKDEPVETINKPIVQNIQIFNNFQRNQPNVEKCFCGELKDRRRYNFCQKCNKLY